MHIGEPTTKLKIFSGRPDKGALWLETVDGLDCARSRMKEMAEKSPGPYFVFCTRRFAVLASIDTSDTSRAK